MSNKHGKKQMTLRETWDVRPSTSKQTAVCQNAAVVSEVVDLCESDHELDDLFVQAAEQSTAEYERQRRSSSASDRRSPEPAAEHLPGFDAFAGKTWIYPVNVALREYQYAIVEKSLFSNTLVVLPTGLGKTFIAAAVMYNFFRWYPTGKIVFMAPTKPLVAQQIEACYNVVGIPQEESSEMTGSNNPTRRKELWHDKRVFFVTPHVMINDLARGACDASRVKLIVVDEAHKALKNYSYCQVVKEVRKATSQFRVLALSATPGNDLQSVNEVISNLLISHVEIRTEDSPDIKPYTFDRIVEQVVVPLGDELVALSERFLEVYGFYVRRLHSQKVLCSSNARMFTKFLLLKVREEFRQNPPTSLDPKSFNSIEADFAISISFSHAFELLVLHGMKSFYHFLKDILEGAKCTPRTRTELMRNGTISEIMSQLEEKFPDLDGEDVKDRQVVASHPKQEKLLEIVLDHFCRSSSENASTRIMIFAQFRDSVQEITELLKPHEPLVRVISFTGQGSANKRSKGLNQKEQLEIVRRFRDGGFNTLVATCVGEEGLDIGEVDLIICYDAHKSPIRLVQRMGRTGRKREGRIVMLLTEGKELNTFKIGDFKKQKIHKSISKGLQHNASLYAGNPRMVPKGLNPVCEKMFMGATSKFKSKDKKETKRKKPNDSSIDVCLAKMMKNKKRRKTKSTVPLDDSFEDSPLQMNNFSICDDFVTNPRKTTGEISDDEDLAKDHLEIETRSEAPIDEENAADDDDRFELDEENRFDRLDRRVDGSLKTKADLFFRSSEVPRSEPLCGGENLITGLRTPPKINEIFPSSKQSLSPVDYEDIINRNYSMNSPMVDEDDDEDLFTNCFVDAHNENWSLMDEFGNDDAETYQPEGDVEGLAAREHNDDDDEDEMECVDDENDDDGSPTPDILNDHQEDSKSTKQPFYPFSVVLFEDEIEDENDDCGCDGDNDRYPVFDSKISYSSDDELLAVNAEHVEKNLKRTPSLYSLTQLVDLVQMNTASFAKEVDVDDRRESPVGGAGVRAAETDNADLKDVRGEASDEIEYRQSGEVTGTQEFRVSGYAVQAAGASKKAEYDSAVPNFKISLELSDDDEPDEMTSSFDGRKRETNSLDVSANSKSRNPFVVRTFGKPRAEPAQAEPQTPCLMSKVPPVSPIEPCFTQRKMKEHRNLSPAATTSTPVSFRQRALNAPCAVVAPVKRPAANSQATQDVDEVQPFKRKNKRAVITDDSPEPHHRITKKPQMQRKRLLNSFIENEAELSGCDGGVSEDEQESLHKSQYGGSFIDDEPVADENWEEIYLDPAADVVNPFRFKMPSNVPENNDEVYSQLDARQDSDYMLDSFCVDDDFVEYKSKKRKETHTRCSPVQESAILISDESSSSPIRCQPEDAGWLRTSPARASTSRSCSLMTKKDDLSSVKSSATTSNAVARARTCASDRLTIFVDSREISGAQAIISDLRHKHKADPVVAQLNGCDYIVSNRMAVERKLFSDIQKVSNRKQLVERIREMIRLFESACLVIEYDRSYEECKRSVPHRSNYLDTMTCALLQLPITVLYSDCQSDTADLLNSLADHERMKGFGFSVDAKLTSHEESLLKLYQVVPDINYVNALYLCKKFNSVRHVASSDATDIMTKGQMSREKSRSVVKFFQNEYR